MPCFRFITGALLRYLAGLVDTSLVCTAPKDCSTGATDPADMAPNDASSLKNSCALIFYPYCAAFFDPGCRTMLDPVVPGAELGQARTYRFHPYCIFARRCLYLQDLCEIAVGPAPLALTEQLAIDEHAIYGRQAFPSAVKIKRSSAVLGVHAVFSVG